MHHIASLIEIAQTWFSSAFRSHPTAVRFFEPSPQVYPISKEGAVTLHWLCLAHRPAGSDLKWGGANCSVFSQLPLTRTGVAQALIPLTLIFCPTFFRPKTVDLRPQARYKKGVRLAPNPRNAVWCVYYIPSTASSYRFLALSHLVSFGLRARLFLHSLSGRSFRIYHSGVGVPNTRAIMANRVKSTLNIPASQCLHRHLFTGNMGHCGSRQIPNMGKQRKKKNVLLAAV